jgi:predicted permease
VEDIRHAIRLWLKSPGFSITAILTMAIGIGASTALMGQINAVFWKPLPVSQPQQLRVMAWTSPRYSFVVGPNVWPGPRINGHETFGSFSYPAYAAMRDQSRTFSDLACWSDLGESRPVVVGELGFAAAQFVSGNYFRTLGVAAALGRTIQPEDDGVNNWSPVVMISDRFWARVFGRDPNVIRQTLRLNGRPFNVVGVMPAEFFGLDPSVSPDVVMPIGAVIIVSATTNPLQNTSLWNPCRVFGRLRADASEAAAQRELEGLVATAIAATPPQEAYDAPRIWLVDARRGLDTLRTAASTPLIVLLAVVVGLLLAACANIAGLLLARGNAREKEIATRLALGAPRRRVVRQLVTESLVLAGAGGVAGVIAAYAFSGLAPALLSQFMPTLYGADRTLSVTASIDTRVLLFGVCATVVAGLLFGVMPALRATRLDLIAVIRQSVIGANPRGFRLSAAQTMVAVEAALAMLLLVGAALFLRTLTNLRNTDLGFTTEGVIYARVEPRSGGLPQQQRRQFFEDAVKQLQVMPGVISASASSTAPLGGSQDVGVRADWQLACVRDAQGLYVARNAAYNAVMPGYFDLLGLRLNAGREFTWSENNPRELPAIVNETFVRRFLAGRAPVGEVIRTGLDCERRFGNLIIVGVVSDGRGLRATTEPAVYLPLGNFTGPVTLMVRTSGDAAAMIPAVRRAIKELNANIPTFSESTLVDLRERQLRRERLLTDLLLLFGAATLVVCCLGIYGMLSYYVARRRAEISVRMAIGARAGDVVTLIVRESLLPVLIGAAAGAIAAAALGRWVESLLFGVTAADPIAMVAATAVLVTVAAIASALPARTASRVDPVLALRQ